MTEAEVRAMFTLAGLEALNVWQLPNAYMGVLEPLSDNEIVRDSSRGGFGFSETRIDKNDPGPTVNVVRSWMSDYRWRHDRPAWLVKTRYGLMEIGWRKRVIQIDWRDTNLRRVVTADDVTKTDTCVHAWSVEKAVEYLRVLAT